MISFIERKKLGLRQVTGRWDCSEAGVKRRLGRHLFLLLSWGSKVSFPHSALPSSLSTQAIGAHTRPQVVSWPGPPGPWQMGWCRETGQLMSACCEPAACGLALPATANPG